MKSIFITGTDTGVGKTTVCSLLKSFLQKQGFDATVQKWIQTGCAAMPKNINICYWFKYPASPHLSAAIEKRKINPVKIKTSFKRLKQDFDYVIVEGIGGALVPYNKKHLVIDIAKELDLPAVIVAANKLGAINHTLLTIEALKKRKMNILGVIFNHTDNKTSSVILKDNIKIIRTLTGIRVLGVLPYSKAIAKLHKAFEPIAERIIRHCERMK